MSVVIQPIIKAAMLTRLFVPPLMMGLNALGVWEITIAPILTNPSVLTKNAPLVTPMIMQAVAVPKHSALLEETRNYVWDVGLTVIAWRPTANV